MVSTLPSSGRAILTAGCLLWLLLCGPSLRAAETDSLSATLTQPEARAAYESARAQFLAHRTNAEAAWKFARAAFDLAEFSSSDEQRAELAKEGIAAAQATIRLAPANVAGHFFLALNKGQLARTQMLGALSLVREMEKSFLRSIELDPEFDHASPHRSLGMLYLDAPGWPASIGSKSKARKHLLEAVELSPTYPENHLTLLEALLRWEDEDALRKGIARYKKLLPAARQTYAGPNWERTWREWDARLEKLLEESRERFGG